MSSRSTKRRRIDIGGRQHVTQQDSLNALQSKHINATSSNGYYLRSSARNSKKRKFCSPINENETKYNKENVQKATPKYEVTATTNAATSKLSKLKSSITSAFTKITKPNQKKDHKERENKENKKKHKTESEQRQKHRSNKYKKQNDKTQITLSSKKINLKSKKTTSGHHKLFEIESDKLKQKLMEKQAQEREERLSQESVCKKYEYDSKGYIIFHKGLTMNERYVVQRRLGKGTFSKVFACKDTDHDNDGFPKKAIKVIRNQHKYQIAARTELRILEYLKNNDKEDEFNVIKLIEASYFEMHPIFIFPLYGRSLYHYLYDNNFRPFPDSHIKQISKQIISAVNYVHSLGVIITDLKPENIIICNDDSERHILTDDSVYFTLKSTKVRLIDFGSAVFDGPPNCVHQHLIQTRHYRAPEVMFKFNWSFPADIWSIGCVIVEISNGKMLFNTHDTIDHLNQIQNAIGEIPQDLIQLIEESVYNELFSFDGKLALHRAKVSNVQCNRLKSYFHASYHKKLYNLVKLMLDWNPETRISAEDALNHPLFQE